MSRVKQRSARIELKVELVFDFDVFNPSSLITPHPLLSLPPVQGRQYHQASNILVMGIPTEPTPISLSSAAAAEAAQFFQLFPPGEWRASHTRRVEGVEKKVHHWAVFRIYYIVWARSSCKALYSSSLALRCLSSAPQRQSQGPSKPQSLNIRVHITE
jgi:hypothetical protein